MLTLPKYKAGDKVLVHYPGGRFMPPRDEEREVVKAGTKWLTIQVGTFTERFHVSTGRMDRGPYSPMDSDPFVTTPEWEVEKAAREAARKRLHHFRGFSLPWNEELSGTQMNAIADILEGKWTGE